MIRLSFALLFGVEMFYPRAATESIRGAVAELTAHTPQQKGRTA